MQESRSFTRRTALAGLGAGTLGLFASQVAGATSRARVASSMEGHPLIGLWLSQVTLPSHRDVVISVPTIFGADGSVVMIYPCTEAGTDGVRIKGAAIGTWEPLDAHAAHFTTVQVHSDIDGVYLGTVTFDGYPLVADDGGSFAVDSGAALLTVRDGLDAVVSSVSGSSDYPMRGFRMTPGNAGFLGALTASGRFPEVAPVYPGDPRLITTELPSVPEVAPVYPGDPRLHPVEPPSVPEVAPVHPDDPRLQPK